MQMQTRKPGAHFRSEEGASVKASFCTALVSLGFLKVFLKGSSKGIYLGCL